MTGYYERSSSLQGLSDYWNPDKHIMAGLLIRTECELLLGKEAEL